jgi:hypothetical protein
MTCCVIACGLAAYPPEMAPKIRSASCRVSEILHIPRNKLSKRQIAGIAGYFLTLLLPKPPFYEDDDILPSCRAHLS